MANVHLGRVGLVAHIFLDCARDTVALNGFTYHPEDLVFFPWFARIQPSTSVNGWYTFLNGFAAPQAVCH